VEQQQQVQFEKEEKAAAISNVEQLRGDVARLDAELETLKASGVDSGGDIEDLKKALEDRQTQLNIQIARVEELETQAGRLLKEKDLINKKMERVQTQKDAETQQLKTALAAASGATQDEINERDRKINELMEDLGNREVRCCVMLLWLQVAAAHPASASLIQGPSPQLSCLCKML
jgi:chromosome segregation ATPase